MLYGAIIKQNKKYYKENKEQILEHNKKYREKNREKIRQHYNEKITCVCGSTVARCGKARHEKSKKHLDWVESKQ